MCLQKKEWLELENVSYTQCYQDDIIKFQSKGCVNPAPVETAMPRHRTIDNSRYLYLVLASLTTGERFTQPRTPAFADHNLVHGPSTTIR